MSPSPCVKTPPLAWEAFLPQDRHGQVRVAEAVPTEPQWVRRAQPVLGAAENPAFPTAAVSPPNWASGMRIQGLCFAMCQEWGHREEEKAGKCSSLSAFTKPFSSRAPHEIGKHVAIQRSTRTIPKEGENLFWSINHLYFPLVFPYLLRWAVLSSQATPGVGLASRVPTALEDSKR